MNILKRIAKKIRVFRELSILQSNKMDNADFWRTNNPHNYTVIQLGDPTKAQVGYHSYGDLHLYNFGNSDEKLSIGNYVSIAPQVKFILSGEHRANTFTPYPIYTLIKEDRQAAYDAGSKGEIVIEDEAWIGYGATILSGVTIGMGAIVASKSVVTKNVPPFAIVGGSPAKFIRWRIPQELIERRSKIRLIDFSKETIIEHIDLFYKPLTQQVLEQIETLPRKAE